MSKGSSVVLANRLFVPYQLVSTDLLERWYYSWTDVRHEYVTDDYGDAVLDEKGDPVKRKVEERMVLTSYKEVFPPNGEQYYSFPRGDLAKLRPFLRHGYEDQRPIRPLGVQLRMSPFTKQDVRWPDQRRCVEEYLNYGYGIIEAVTGSGKTVMGTAALTKMGMTTLLVSTLVDGVTQWINELRKHTNLRAVEDQLGRELIGAYSPRLLEPYPITVSTIQAFLHPTGREFLRRYRDFFGLFLIDEVHTAASPEYIKVLQCMNPFAYLGLSATVDRVDRRHLLLFDVVGPVVAKGTANQMPPTVYFIHTGEEAPGWVYKNSYPDYYQWNVVLGHLARSEARLDLVQKFVYQDIDDNRTLACIAERRVFAKALYRRLVQDGYRAVYVDGETKAKLRDKIYNEFREGKYQVICAGKVLNALIDLPNLDCIHLLTPSNSKATSKQIYGRSRRPLPGKRNPIIRYYVDKGGQLDGAFKNQQRLCKENNWAMEMIGQDAARMVGLSLWKKRK